MTTLDAAYVKVQAGDRDAFAGWARLVEPPLRRSLRSFARAVDVEVVMQEVLLRMWKLAPGLHLSGPGASLRYALRMARNMAISETRRCGSKLAVPLDDIAEPDLPVVSPAPASDPILRTAILDCIQKLPGSPRKALMARLGSGGEAPDRDLAESVGMQKNTFLQNVVRARKLIAGCLEHAGYRLREVLP